MGFNRSLNTVFGLIGLCVVLSVSVFADSESGGWQISNCPEDPYIEFSACNYFAYDFDVSGPIDESHHFVVLEGPGTIDPATGNYLLAPDEISEPQWIEIAVIDEDGDGDECSFHLTPRTEPRTIVNCPDEILRVTEGFVVGYFFFAESNCTQTPTGYTILERDGIVGDLTISPIGELEFRPDSQDVGRHTVLVAATDAFTTGPPCAMEFEVLAQAEYAVRIEVEAGANGTGALLGTEGTVDVSLDSYEQAITGFEFLFSYPVSALSFIYADTVGAAAFETCGWEYFTYHMEPAAEPGPLGFVRVMGIAEINSGNVHPDLECDISGALFRLRFFISSNANYECMFLPVRFYWRDCDDNVLSGIYSTGPYVSRHVFDTDGGFTPTYFRIDNLDGSFPTPSGYQSDECPADISFHGSGQTFTVDFYNGGVQTKCVAQIPNVGDLNFDDLAFTTADAVIFTNYLVHGWDAFVNLPQGVTQDLILLQSDVNGDGIGLTLADFCALLAEMGVDWTPPPGMNPPSATIKLEDHRLWVSTPCAAAHIVVFGEVQPTLLAPNMTMLTGSDGEYTSILVYSWDPAQSFEGTFIDVGGDVLALTMVDASGVQFAPTLVPTTWSLSQNYPNPFNPITTIEFSLPKRTHIDLEIFNVSGQRVGLTSGVFGPGQFQTTWDGSDHASGVYWYRLTTDEFTASRKMLMVK